MENIRFDNPQVKYLNRLKIIQYLALKSYGAPGGQWGQEQAQGIATPCDL